MDTISQIEHRAKEKKAHIILPESNDRRIIKASRYLADNDICSISLVGDQNKIKKLAIENDIELSPKIAFLKLNDLHEAEELGDHLYKRRKHKGITRDEAKNLLEEPLYLAASMVATGRADGCVAGSIATTGEVIKAAIQTIGLREQTSIVSSTFLMVLEDHTFTYADCGVVPYPDPDELADIAIESAETHRLLTQQEPIVAMLSFSTKGSAEHEKVDHVIRALEIAKQRAPDLVIDGELQFDAAFVPSVAQRKVPDSEVAGKANVFIFPNLDAGNIAYKITERLGGAAATGPILQGLCKPMMDLSRGCNWRDVVNAVCVAILMSEK